MNASERRATAALGSIFALRMLGLFMIVPVFAVYGQQYRGATPALLGLVVAHIIALHEVGSNNPDGVEIKGPNAPKDAEGHPMDGIPFHPFYTVHDIFGVSVFLLVFSAVVFFAPEAGGYFLEYNNFIPADPLKTPNHIAPVWYFTPFYSMLRATNDEMVNVLCVIIVAAVVLAAVTAAAPAVCHAMINAGIRR